MSDKLLTLSYVFIRVFATEIPVYIHPDLKGIVPVVEDQVEE